MISTISGTWTKIRQLIDRSTGLLDDHFTLRKQAKLLRMGEQLSNLRLRWEYQTASAPPSRGRFFTEALVGFVNPGHPLAHIYPANDGTSVELRVQTLESMTTHSTTCHRTPDPAKRAALRQHLRNREYAIQRAKAQNETEARRNHIRQSLRGESDKRNAPTPSTDPERRRETAPAKQKSSSPHRKGQCPKQPKDSPYPTRGCGSFTAEESPGN